MQPAFQFTSDAFDDLDDISSYIALDSPRSAARVEREIIAACGHLAEFPRSGIWEPDLGSPPVRVWTVTTFPNYRIVYDPDTIPIQILAVIQGKRDLKRVMKQRRS